MHARQVLFLVGNELHKSVKATCGKERDSWIDACKLWDPRAPRFTGLVEQVENSDAVT